MMALLRDQLPEAYAHKHSVCSLAPLFTTSAGCYMLLALESDAVRHTSVVPQSHLLLALNRLVTPHLFVG